MPQLSWFLINIGTGALLFGGINYYKQQELLPTKHLVWIGVIALIGGIILQYI